jgi:hypothetical protein
MPSASSLTSDSRFMALFVGEKHSGKTAAACSFYKKEGKKKVKVLDGDGRIRGLLGCPWIDRSRIDYDYYPPRIAGNNKPFYQRVNDDLEAMLIDINSGRTPYETYVGDSATAFCKNLILDALPLTHADNKGRSLGTMQVTGIEEFKFEAAGMDQYLSFLRSIPLNVILTAHVIDKYGKPPGDPYAESQIIGEKLSLRDKIAANSSIYFNHIFRFRRKMVQNKEMFTVEFIGPIACTSFTGLTPGEHDITGKNFYEFLMAKVNATSTVTA